MSLSDEEVSAAGEAFTTSLAFLGAQLAPILRERHLLNVQM
jgi:hypothetical protein